MTEREQQPQRVDSRRWTGRGIGPTRAERRAAWQAFHAAAGPGAKVPRRTAAIASALLGCVLVPLSLVAATPAGSRLHDRLTGAADPATVRWLAAFVGPAAMIALVASLGGIVSTWRNREALARGFAAAPPARLEGGGADAALGVVAIGYLLRIDGVPPAAGMLLLWVAAFFLARGLTLIAERACAPDHPRAGEVAKLTLGVAAVSALLTAAIAA